MTVELKSAEEMRQITSEYYGEIGIDSKLVVEIERRAILGMYAYTFKGILSVQAKDRLMALGYRVKTYISYDEYWTKISWGES